MTRLPSAAKPGKGLWQRELMAGNPGNSTATTFGAQMRQMRQMRQSHHWTLREMSVKTGVSFSVLSRVETGDRPPTERVARALDVVFPELPADFFLNTWSSSRLYAPAGFVDWSEVEDTAADLTVWAPGIIDGLGQVEPYARALLTIHPGQLLNRSRSGSRAAWPGSADSSGTRGQTFTCWSTWPRCTGAWGRLT